MRSERYVQLVGSASGAQLRTAEFNGSSYIVCPVIAMIGDSVVWPVNAEYPEFVPADVLSLCVGQWNSRPVVMNHPTLGDNYVSAGDPEILERYGYGHTFGSRFEDNKLKLEAWLDPVRAKKVGPDAERVLERLSNGEIVEISIGAFIVVEDEHGTTANGQEYKARWVLAMSDHLATLSEGLVGACSVEMGCGALRVNRINGGGKVPVLQTLALSQARKPAYSGTETSSWSAPSLSDYVKYLFEGANGPSSVSQMSSELKRKISAHSLLGDPEANNIRDLAVFPCVNPSNGKLNEKALRAVLGGRGDQADISESALESARDMARRLLNSEFAAELENAMAKEKGVGLLSRLLKSLSSLPGMLKDNMSSNSLKNKLWDALSDIEPGLYWVEDHDPDLKLVWYTTRIAYGFEYENKIEMYLWQRSFNIGADENVTLNDDRQEAEYVGGYRLVNRPPDEDIIVVTESHECTCKGDKGEKTMGLDTVKRKELIGKLVTDEKDVKALEALSDEALERLSAAVPTSEKPSTPEKSAEVVVNAEKPKAPQTEEEWLASAPEAIRLMVESNKQKERAHRTDLITKLKASSHNKFTEDRLTKMDTDTLETLASSLCVAEGVPDYSMRGVPMPTTGDDEIYLNPPDPWAKQAN